MSELITTLTILFGITSLALAAAKKFNQPVIPTYIIAGVIAGSFIQEDQILNLAQIGIAFLVFVFGLKFDPGRLESVAKESQTVTTLQIAVIGTSSYLVALALGFDSLNSLYFSLAASMSSTLIGLDLIEEELQLDLIHGRLAESIHLIQDLIAIIAAAILVNTQLGTFSILTSLGYACLIIGSALIAREYIYPRLIEQAEGTTEIVMLTGLTILIGYASIAQQLGVSIIVGSFAAGLTAAKFPYNSEMIDTLGSVKDFFSIIFFTTLGALLSIPSLQVAATSLVLVLFSNIIKPGITIMPLLKQGYDSRTAYLTGFNIDQISEFALIIAIQAYTINQIAPAMFESIILATTGSMIISSYTSRHQDKLYQKLSKYQILDSSNRKIKDQKSIEDGLNNHIIVVGYDIQGKNIVEHLNEIDQDYIVIENSPEKVLELKKRGENYIYGDVMHDKVWREAKVEKAQLIVSTVPIIGISREILTLDIDAEKMLRTDNIDDAAELMDQGAYYVSVEDILSSEVIREHVVGITKDKEYREELRRRNLLEIKRYLEEDEG